MGKTTRLHPAIKSISSASGVSAIIASIKEGYGTEFAAIREEILHCFTIAKDCESHSVMMLLLRSGQEQVELKIVYHPEISHGSDDYGNQFRDAAYFKTTLAGLLVGEKELRELMG